MVSMIYKPWYYTDIILYWPQGKYFFDDWEDASQFYSTTKMEFDHQKSLLLTEYQIQKIILYFECPF